jgi:hypothetical protein
MKDELPLTDRDFANVRKSVMAAIEARQARRVWTIRVAQLAFAVLAVAIGAWWMMRPANAPAPALPVPNAGQTAETQSNTTFPQPQIQQTPAQQPAPQSHVATSEGHHNRTIRTASRRQHHQTPVREIASTEPLRLELRTDDPDIRIIWITNPNASR